MQGTDLRIRAKNKLAEFGVCPICNEFVYESDDLTCITYRKNHVKEHTFFHTKCIAEARKAVRRV